jgi:hypothetical protein
MEDRDLGAYVEVFAFGMWMKTDRPCGLPVRGGYLHKLSGYDICDHEQVGDRHMVQLDNVICVHRHLDSAIHYAVIVHRNLFVSRETGEE